MLVSLAHATFRYQAHVDDDTELVGRVRALTTRYPRYGYRRITALIRQKEVVNEQRVRRIWRHQGLHVKRLLRPRRVRSRSIRLEATNPGHIWAYDFVERMPARRITRATRFLEQRTPWSWSSAWMRGLP